MEKLTNAEVKALSAKIKKELNKVIDEKNEELQAAYCRSEEGTKLIELTQELKELEKQSNELYEKQAAIKATIRDNFKFCSYDYCLDSILKVVAPQIPYASLEEIKNLIVLANLEEVNIGNLIEHVKASYLSEAEI